LVVIFCLAKECGLLKGVDLVVSDDHKGWGTLSFQIKTGRAEAP